MYPPSKNTHNSFHRHHTNWHEAAVCTIRITLRDYEHLLVIRRLAETNIPHSIARIFRSYNLFEINTSEVSYYLNVSILPAVPPISLPYSIWHKLHPIPCDSPVDNPHIPQVFLADPEAPERPDTVYNPEL